MNIEDLTFAPALKLSTLIKEKTISPLELTQLYLDRIKKLDGRLGSFSYVAQKEALTDARHKTEQIGKLKDTSELPLFFGIPTGVKDLYSVAGMPCSFGNLLLKDNITDYDDGFVTRIKQAGFIILGKTAASEFGSLPYTESPGLPPSRNPYNLDYTSGGSSGGAAAAVAAGLIPIAVGSDGGGSVRGPAFCCGLVGLKPSRGRISNAPFGEYQGGIATHGCFSRNVADTAALLDVLSGYTTGDPYWLPNPKIPFLEASQKSTKKLTIAFATSVLPVGEATEILQKQVQDVATILNSMGHSLIETCPDFSSLVKPFATIWQAGITTCPLPNEALSPMNLWLKETASSLPEYLQAVYQMHTISRQIVALFDDFDVLLLPTYLQPPIKVGQWADLSPQETLDKIINWITPCPPFNATGQPAIAIPTGFTDEGLPVGVQLVGKPASEEIILSLAYQIEQIKLWNNYQPNFKNF